MAATSVLTIRARPDSLDQVVQAGKPVEAVADSGELADASLVGQEERRPLDEFPVLVRGRDGIGYQAE